MSPSPLLVVSIGALAATPLVAALALAGRDSSRAAINRSIATVERGYSAAPVATAPAPGTAGGSLIERVGSPLAQRVGGVGAIVTPKAAAGRLQRWLDYAGNPVNWPADRVVAAKGFGLLLGTVGGGLFGLLLGGATTVVLAALIGAALGYFVPDLAIYNVGVKRQEEIGKTLPDTLDTLTISIEAGQGFDAALAQVARNGRGPLVGEAARVLQEMRIGKSRAEALRAMAERTTVPELRGFASAVIQASDLGVAVGQVLREQAKEMRVRRRQRAEELAQKIPVKILFPTLFCLFPALFVVILGPGVINIIATFKG